MNGLIASLTTALLGTLLLWAPAGGTPPSETPIGWRTDGTGSYPGTTPPQVWSKDKNAVWKTKLPGHSQGSPILVGDRLFVVSDPAELLCLNAADGKVVWQQSCGFTALFGAEKAKAAQAEYKRQRGEIEKLERAINDSKDDAEKQKDLRKGIDKIREEMNTSPLPPEAANGEATNSAPTPVCGGKNVYVVFGNGIIGAFTVTGERKWIKFLESPTIGFGNCGSPVLAEGKLIVHLNNLFALNAETGEPEWQAKLDARHASPVLTEVEGTKVIISPAGAVVRLSDGKVLLRDNVLSSSESTPVLQDGVLYTMGEGSSAAVRLIKAEDDAVKLETLWTRKVANGRRTPSPVLHEGLLYGVNTDGILDVLDAKSGEVVYKQRLNIGSVYSSAVAAGDLLYVSSTKGTTAVVATGRKYREVGKNELESFGSNPVFRDKQMFVRTRGHLFCIGQ